MRSLTPLVSRSVNAPLAWLATLALALTVVGFLLAGDPHWAVLSALLVALALAPPAVERDASVTFPGTLLVLVALPAVVRLAGLFPQATPFLAVAGLALLAVTLLDEYSSLAMTTRFAVFFVVVTTLAFAGVWAAGTWLSDQLLGTAFVAGQQELMWDLVVAAGMGVVAGGVLYTYFDQTEWDDDGSHAPVLGPDDGASPDDGGPVDTGSSLDAGGRTDDGPAAGEPRASGDDTPETGDDIPEMTDDDEASRAAQLAVYGMQALLVGMAAFAAWRGNWGLLVNSSVPLAVTLLPALLRREYGYSMHAGLVFWLTLAVFLHAVGVLGPYRQFGWYDSVTHALSGTLAAGVGYAVARAVELHTRTVSFDAAFRAVFVLLFVLATAVCWELLEFSTGLLAVATGGEAALVQYGVDDIVMDIVYSTVGGLVVAAWGTGYFERPARALVGRVGALVGRE